MSEQQVKVPAINITDDVNFNSHKIMNLANGTAASDAAAYGQIREKLTAPRTYYVATTGSDSNNGLSSGSPFLTVQKAVDVISALDIAGYTTTVQLADGTYTNPVVLKNVSGFSVGGNLIIRGNATTPSNVVISTTANNCFSKDGSGSIWEILDLKVTITTSGYCLYAVNGGIIWFGNLDFGAIPSTGSSHILARQNGIIVAVSNYAVSGGGYIHIWSDYGGIVDVSSKTIIFSNSPTFTYFSVFSGCGITKAYNMTFTNGGTVTGTRYYGYLNGVVQTNGSSTYFPGTIAGSVASGAQYA